MAEAGNTATPPAASGGIDQNAIAQAIATALATALPAAIAEANKPIVEALRTQQPAAGTQAGAAKSGPLTAEDVTRIVGDQLKTFQQTATQTQQRQQFQETKLKDIPAVYRNQLGNDPAKWAAEEQQIRQQYQADFKTAGGTAPNVGGENPGGAAPGAAAGNVDLSKMTPGQLLELGLKQSPAVRGQAAPGAGQASTATGTGQVAGTTAGASPAAAALKTAM